MDPKVYLKVVAVVALLGFLGVPFAADSLQVLVSPRTDGGCRVVSVTDGDTVRIHCPGRGLEKARLVGFDTPETFSPSCLGEYARGLRATWALRMMLLRAERVTLVRQGEDRYGRALVFMALDDRPLAAAMIEAGYAKPYRGGTRPGWCSGNGRNETRKSGGARYV